MEHLSPDMDDDKIDIILNVFCESTRITGEIRGDNPIYTLNSKPPSIIVQSMQVKENVTSIHETCGDQTSSNTPIAKC